MELEAGRRDTRHRLETQILHFDGQDWHAYTYRWNDEQTDAALVEAAGGETTLRITDPDAPDGYRQQHWRFHSRAECLRCHNPWATFALAFTGPQLDRAVAYKIGGKRGSDWRSDAGAVTTADQLKTLCQLGVLDKAPAARRQTILTNPYDSRGELNRRARSWLHVNCSHCHREGAGGSVVSHFDYESKLPDMKAIGRSPSQGTLGLAGAQVICPGAPCSSVLFYRISTTGQGRMPLIGSTEVDTRGVRLIHDWIEHLDRESAADSAQASAAGGTNLFFASIRALQQSASSTEAVQAALDALLASPNGALALMTAVQEHSIPARCTPEWTARVARDPSFQVRDLFARFLPEHLRPKRLGLTVNPEQILSLNGDTSRGRALFLAEASQCPAAIGSRGKAANSDPT